MIKSGYSFSNTLFVYFISKSFDHCPFVRSKQRRRKKLNDPPHDKMHCDHRVSFVKFEIIHIKNGTVEKFGNGHAELTYDKCHTFKIRRFRLCV